MKTDNLNTPRLRKAIKKPENKGDGHKAHIAVVLDANVEIDGKEQHIHFDYDITVTIEHIDYMVRQIAGSIAQVASKVARDGVKERQPVD